ncbi:MAG TPA: MFS transporter [Microbacteriaceae bacterium]
MTADETIAERFGDSGRPGRSGKPAGIFGREYLWISIGMCALVTLAAFESMAVTTIMPMISAELNGASVYALAFAGPLAVGVVGMVLAGNWSDRNGPRGALYASAVSFVVGLAVVGTASSMGIFILGRLVQGLGAGGLTVALYVIIARVYPPRLHPPIFAAFAAAWVVPSLVGPLIAGLVADYVGWRWVFLGVIALVFVAAAMVIPALRSLVHDPIAAPDVPWNFGRIGWAVLAAAAVLGVNLSADAAGLVFWGGPIVAIVVAVIALRPLLPGGTLRLRAGLPAVIVMRGLLAGSFFGAEVYIPYLLTKEYGFVAAGAGLALTASGLTWAGGSWLQSKFATQLSHVVSFRIGASLLSAAVLTAALTAALSLPPALAIIGWAIGGAGMGLMYPRTSVLTLEYSTIENQGFNSSALSIADSIGASIALAATAIVFAVLLPLGGAWPFAGCFILTALLGICALVLSPRVAQRA